MDEVIENLQLIDVFDDKHPLSNCYLHPVEYRGRVYASVEHAYQLFKFFDEDSGEWTLETFKMLRIMNAPTGMEAKRIGKEYEDQMIVTDRDLKVKLAFDIMYKKFAKDENLRRALLETTPTILFEQNLGESEAEKFWGVDLDGVGDNVIGNILMQIREELA